MFLLFYIFQKSLLLIIGGTKRFAFIIITGARARADPRVYAYACSAKTYFPLYFILCAYLARNSGVARQFGARGRTVKLAPLPGLFFHKIQIYRLRFYNFNFNEIKYYKADECVIIRRPSSVNL